MTRLDELAFVAACLPAAAALALAVAVIGAMWLIRALLHIPGVRTRLAATVCRLLPAPRHREAHMGAMKSILTDLDAAIHALEEHGHQLAGRFRDLYERLAGELRTVVPAAETAVTQAVGEVEKAAQAADPEVKA